FTLDTLDWGFMRPRRANDRGLAYAQAEWIVEYIEQRWGHPTLLTLLKAFQNRKTQETAFREVLKLPPEQFMTEFKAWANKQVESWGLPAAPVGELLKLKATAALSPKDAAAQAKLAEAAWYSEDVATAESAARAALKADRNQSLASEVLGRLLVLR